jgi:hypothetical protein
MMTITRYSKTPAGGSLVVKKSTDSSLGKGLNNNILPGQLPMLSCHQMKTNQWPKPLKNSTSDPIMVIMMF